MKKLFPFLFILLFSTTLFAQDDPVYLGMTVESGGLIIEDHITYQKNAGIWGRTDIDMDYDGYLKYITDIVKKYASYSDTVNTYYIEGWKDEFSKLTNIKPGEPFYISAPDKVYETKIKGYYINLNDQIGGGVIFYPFAGFESKNKTADYEVFACSPKSITGKTDKAGITDKETVKKFKQKLLPMLKNVKFSEYENDKEKWHKVTSIADDEIKVFKGNFTGKENQYLVSYTKRLSFDSYASAILIMDEKGKVIDKVTPLLETNFEYATALGTVDVNSDGVLEILAEAGYYEGRGFQLYKFSKEGFILTANGFYFGV